jgi:hypothetical protein
MKKLVVFSLLAVGVMGTNVSFAQNVEGKKAEKKEAKADNKEAKGKTKKAMKKDEKMDKKEAKAK